MKPERYLLWQTKLTTQKLYRYFWVTFGIYSVSAVFVIGAILLLSGQWKIAAVAFIAFAIARLVLSPLVYFLYKKPRPYQKFNFTVVSSWLLSPIQKRSNAFPSDHAASLAAISFVFYYYLPIVGLFMFGLTVLNGMARIILGYHDELDILAGWFLGVLAAIITIKLLVPVVFTTL